MTTFTAPIESSDNRDVTDELNLWIAATLIANPGTPDNPTVLELGDHLCQYGLSLGSNGHDIAHPDLPAYTPENFIIRGGKIRQNDNGLYRKKNPDGTYTVLDKRKRWGVNLLKVRGAKNFRFEGTSFEGGNSLGKGSVYSDKEDWIGFKLVGCENAHFEIEIDDVWSDFVYFSNLKTELDNYECKDIHFNHSAFRTCGRQGFVINAINNLLVENSEIRNVRRFTIDAEPFNGGITKNVVFQNNDMSGGNLGTVQLSVPGRIECENFQLLNNNIMNRALTVDIPNAWITEDGIKKNVQRKGLVIEGNVCDNAANPYNGRGAMIKVTGWNEVSIQDNSAYVDKLTRTYVGLTRCPDAAVDNNQMLLPTV